MARASDELDAGSVARALRAAWDELIAELGRARDAIDEPKLWPPPPSERVLAEGYRYLLGWLHGSFERAFHGDPLFPRFRRAIQPISKSTIDNADALYLNAEIDGEHSYVVRGRAADHRHWRGEAPAQRGRKAPQYVIFEATTAYAGDSGSVAELRPGARARTGMLDSTELAVAADGRFEVLLAPERPAGHTGNFIATQSVRSVRREDGAREPVVHTARNLTLRELFHDWEREDLLDLEIVRLGAEAEHPSPLDAQRAIQQMQRMGQLAKHQMHSWNEFYAVVLETHADMNGDGQRFMPRNAFNDLNAAALATGGGQSTNIYSGGVYELAEDEALIVESRVSTPPLYQGFHLSNLWGESHDYANHQSSLNAFQAEWDRDGALRLVIAHQDPGVPNWIDTTGDPVGFMTPRWTYSVKPERLPTIHATKVRFDEIRTHLPADVRHVSLEERHERIRMRQAHVQRRYRQY
jgi:hypothetical protein